MLWHRYLGKKKLYNCGINIVVEPRSSARCSLLHICISITIFISQLYKQPFCAEFVQFYLDNFVVGVWSSALEHNAHALLIVSLGMPNRSLHLFGFQASRKPIQISIFKRVVEIVDKL